MIGVLDLLWFVLEGWCFVFYLVFGLYFELVGWALVVWFELV